MQLHSMAASRRLASRPTIHRCKQVYGEVAKEVAPKRAKLQAAQDNLAKKQAQLTAAQEKLAAVLAAVQTLKDKYDVSTASKKALEKELADLEVKLERAEKLVTGLTGEKARWQASISDLECRIGNLPVRSAPPLFRWPPACFCAWQCACLWALFDVLVECPSCLQCHRLLCCVGARRWATAWRFAILAVATCA
jgi:hypothetical protein